jgi:hypothetical protein
MNAYDIKKPLKKNRILFYGTDNSNYNSDEIKHNFKLLTRYEVFQIIKDSDIPYINPDNINDLLSYLENPNIINSFVFIDSDKIWIPQDLWLKILSSFDFFIATPGVIMPHSHNSIEAMSTETILITQYAKWFAPNLVDKLNCLEFDNKNELISVINYAMNLSNEEVILLRYYSNLYYKKFIDPSSFGNRLKNLNEDTITLIFNAEEYSI